MNKLRVLFVALSTDSVTQTAALLSDGGFGLEQAQVSSSRALNEALARKWDVILIGLSTSLPLDVVVDSLNSRNLDIPIIVLITDAEKTDLAGVLQRGAQDCLNIVDRERLIPTVQREMIAATMRLNLREQVVTEYLLHEIDQLILQGCDEKQLVNNICRRMVELFNFKLVWIGMKSPQGLVEIVGNAGEVDYLKGKEVRWDDTSTGPGVAGLAIRGNKPIVLRVDDYENFQWKERAAQFGMNSVMAVPLGFKGDVIGALMLYSGQHDTFDPLTVTRMSAFASRVTVGILVAQEQRELRLMQTAMNCAGNAMLITSRDGTIEWVNDAVTQFSGLPVENLLGQNPRIFSSGQHNRTFWKSLWGAILSGKVWHGDIVNRFKNGNLYTVTQTVSPLFDDKGAITHFLAIQQDITEKKQMEKEIHYLAYHDTLTKLPNRILFQDRVQLSMVHAKRNDRINALLFLDLDGFKNVNDELGHAKGDEVLMQVSKRLLGCIRGDDTVARLGGDEFTVLLMDVGSKENVRRVANIILKRIRQPYNLGEDHQGHISASIGVSLYPGDGDSFDELLSNADKAMYHAKLSGKNCLAFFNVKDEAVQKSE